ncbi:hypothetical protein JW758_00325 [Candidatus Peregrinibacteria bacterium]|nr:hypothetical protein [Candidatus Peregrinibacteria bacterium]
MKVIIIILFLSSITYLIFVKGTESNLKSKADKTEQICLDMEKKSGVKKYGKYPLSTPGEWHVSYKLKIMRLDKPKPEINKWKWNCGRGTKLVDRFYFDSIIDKTPIDGTKTILEEAKNCIGYICERDDGRYIFSSASCDGFFKLAANREEWLLWSNPSYCVCPKYVFDTIDYNPSNQCNLIRGFPLKE